VRRQGRGSDDDGTDGADNADRFVGFMLVRGAGCAWRPQRAGKHRGQGAVAGDQAAVTCSSPRVRASAETTRGVPLQQRSSTLTASGGQGIGLVLASAALGSISAPGALDENLSEISLIKKCVHWRVRQPSARRGPAAVQFAGPWPTSGEGGGGPQRGAGQDQPPGGWS